MKLIVFGRDAQQADIVLNSQYVSGYHAELIQLDNGDMYLVDKSSNGTYLNGERLTPGKEYVVHRGDKVTFADLNLDWNMVEDLHLPANVKTVKSIGSHYMNNIKIQGVGVSRFHATLRETRDGKWFICDYSKNGTSVNGQRLQKNKFTPIKAGDEITCAGVPVPNPIKRTVGGIGGWIAGSVAVVAIVVAAIFGISRIDRPMTPDQIFAKYSPSAVFMLCDYYFHVDCGSLDISDLPDPDSWSEKRQRFMASLDADFVIDEDDCLSAFDGDNGMFYTATGFFIGENGNIATNLHVARPWLSKRTSAAANITVLSAAEDYYRAKLRKLVDMGYTPALQYIAQVKVTGKLYNSYIVQDGEYLDENNLIRCTEVIASDDQNIDLAIFRIRQKDMPVGCTFVPLNKISMEKPKIGETVYTYGFPFGLYLQSDLKNKVIKGNSVRGDITKEDDDNAFLTTAPIAQGASGSPVFNNKGQLVGVMNATAGDNFNYGIYAFHLMDLIQKAKIDK